MAQTTKNMTTALYRLLQIALLVSPVAGGYFLFSPVLQCLRDFHGFADDCRNTLGMTLTIPVPIGCVLWLVLLTVFLFVRKKMRSAREV